jgi:hypothetical protein
MAVKSSPSAPQRAYGRANAGDALLGSPTSFMHRHTRLCPTGIPWPWRSSEWILRTR